jgi:D-3-phosphoglycerate dehydrogenase / 2-oxoglutarate reductase
MNLSFRVLVLDGVSPKGVEILERNPHFTVVVKGSLKEPELIETIKDFDAVVVRSQTKITAKAIAAANKLAVIGRAGVGVDNVDVDAATERGIIVMNTPGGNTISTAEHAFSLLLSMARNIPQATASMREGKWDRKSFQGVELCNKVLGIVGMGRIGSEVARRAIAFGMRVIAYDPYLAAGRARSMQVELADELPTLLTQADFITVHMPMTPETKGIIDAKAIAQCKKGIRLINCARGGLIVEADLIAALKSKHVAAAAIDVFEKEPPAPDFELLKLPNVVLTPHLGASTNEAQESVGIEIAEAIHDFLAQGIVRNAVNAPNVDTRTLAVIRPYLQLGEKLGSALAQLAPKGLDTLLVTYSGKVTEVDTTPVTRTILKGLLTNAGGSEVNEINAPKLAKNCGLNYSETKASQIGDFTDFIRVEVAKGSEKYAISGTFFGPHARIVRINDFSLEAAPEGYLFIMENKDRPGIVGWIGSLLGKHKVNIASMSLSRTEPGSRALSVLNLDSAPEEDVLKEIAADPDIYSVKVVKL